MNQLYNILLFHPDRLCNAEILSTLSQNENEIDQHVLTDRLLSMKLPIGMSFRKINSTDLIAGYLL